MITKTTPLEGSTTQDALSAGLDQSRDPEHHEQNNSRTEFLSLPT